MTDELLLQLRDEIVCANGMTEADLAADVRERLARLNLLVLPGPQPMETADAFKKDETQILIYGDFRLAGYCVEPGDEDRDWHIAYWDPLDIDGEGGYWSDGFSGWITAALCWMPMPPIPGAATLRRIAKGVTPEMIANGRHPNGAPKWASDGTLLDDRGKRSIFDDVGE